MSCKYYGIIWYLKGENGSGIYYVRDLCVVNDEIKLVGVESKVKSLGISPVKSHEVVRKFSVSK